MPPDKRLLAADAFWRDTDDDAQLQHVEAIVSLARHMRFRSKSVQALPLEKRARQLAQIGDVSDAIATRGLIAYHFAHARPLMAAFLNHLGIANDDGQITSEELTPPEATVLGEAVAAVRAAFPAADVDLYLRTLTTLDAGTWGALEAIAPE